MPNLNRTQPGGAWSAVTNISWALLILAITFAAWMNAPELYQGLFGWLFGSALIAPGWVCDGPLPCFVSRFFGLFSLVIYPMMVYCCAVSLRCALYGPVCWRSRLFQAAALVVIASAARLTGVLFVGTWLS